MSNLVEAFVALFFFGWFAWFALWMILCFGSLLWEGVEVLIKSIFCGGYKDG